MTVQEWIRNIKNQINTSQHLSDTIPFDETKQTAVIKCSICNGEQVAGFKNNEDGSFTEVMLIRDKADLEYFKAVYNITEIKKIY